MKKALFIISCIFIVNTSFGQWVYDTHEPSDMKWVTYGDYSGKLTVDTLNMMQDLQNMSAMCGKYVRSDTMIFNFMKMHPNPSDSTWDFRLYHGPHPLTGLPIPTKKMKMKIWTTADSNSVIELNVGVKNPLIDPMDSMISSIHSQYRAFTHKKKQWEEVQFDFVYYQNDTGLSDTAINKIVLVFNPYIKTADSLATDSAARRMDTLYFDDFTGPEFYRRPAPVNNSISTLERNGYEFKQNVPNPSNGLTRFEYYLKNTVPVKLTLYNILGKTVSVLVDEKKEAGRHNVNYDTSGLTKGIYYYTIKVGEFSATRKMIVN